MSKITKLHKQHKKQKKSEKLGTTEGSFIFHSIWLIFAPLKIKYRNLKKKERNWEIVGKLSHKPARFVFVSNFFF